jgi:methylated-DNA-protein-cysteine methyltransferase-like protein
MTEYTCKIIEIIQAIPKGKVTCYRDIAAKAGLPNGARQVVRVLHSLSEKHNLPWYRILRADGSIALEGEGAKLQAELLRKEGIEVSKEYRVDFHKYGWH